MGINKALQRTVWLLDWNNWHGGKSKLLRYTEADAGSLKRNLHHYLVCDKAAHENQLMIMAQVSGLKKQEMQRKDRSGSRHT